MHISKLRSRILILLGVISLALIIGLMVPNLAVKELGMFESDTINIYSEINNNETSVDYSFLMNDNRGGILHKKKDLGLNLKEWTKEFTLTFFKEGTAQTKVHIYTIEKDKLDNQNPFFLYDNKYAVAEIITEASVFKRVRYTKFSQDIFNNLERISN